MVRRQYLNKLIEFRDKPIIKTIVGIRRCGKSTLLMMYKDYLIESGVHEDDILMMNLSHMQDNGRTTRDIINMVSEHKGRMYILLDEIQNLTGWDRMVLEMLETLDCDIYITGSNSVMFSSKLTTLLSGRAIGIEMFPFSYAEFLEFTTAPDSDESLMEYMTFGGFPLSLMLRGSKSAQNTVVEDVYNTVVLKDIVLRQGFKNNQLLDRMCGFLMRSIGSPLSVKSIKDYLSSAGVKTTSETVDTYLSYLEESLTFYRAKRFNIKAKEELVFNDKFYVVDPGLRTAVLGHRGADTGHILENLVYIQLRRDGYKVYVGKMDNLEIDFVAINSDRTLYVQVCYSLRDPVTEEREVRPLRKIRDNHRKILVVMEKSLNTDRDGIEEMGIREFLRGGW